MVLGTTNIKIELIEQFATAVFSPCLVSTLRWTKRHDGQWVLSRCGGSVCLVVPEDERVILEALGHIPNSALCERYDITHQDLVHLLTILAQADLLDVSLHSVNPAVDPGNYLAEGSDHHNQANRKQSNSIFHSHRSRRQFWGKGFWHKCHWEGLWCKIPLGSPQIWLSQCGSVWDKIQSRWLWLSGFMVLTVLIALGQSINQSTPLTSGFIGAGSTTLGLIPSPFAFSLLVWGAILLITFCHELAHSLSLQHYGLPVAEWGIVAMLGLVGIYVDLSLVYHLHQRWQRLHVLLAGIWFQGVIAAAAWWLGQISWLNLPWLPWQWWWQIVCWIGWGSLLWNLNPLVRTDGYYALVTWTESWNLQAASWDLYAKAWRQKR